MISTDGIGLCGAERVGVALEFLADGGFYFGVAGAHHDGVIADRYDLRTMY